MALSNKSSNLNNVKSSVKWLDIPIQKFNAAVPHFVELLKAHNSTITKLKRLNQWEEMKKELVCASRTVSQLASLLREIDNLRNQVVDADLTKFDKLISQSKQTALSAIQTYQDISIPLMPSQYVKNEDINVIVNEEVQEQKLRVLADITEEIKTQEQLATSIERIHEDVEDIYTLHQQLSQLVHDQGENVEKIEGHVDTTHHNVVEGEKMLCQAAKYKNGMYPLFGAVIGSILGGPIGLLAGFKLGGMTAVGFGILGFTGGKILKNQNEVTVSEAERHRQELEN